MEFDLDDTARERLLMLLNEDMKHGEMPGSLVHLGNLIAHCAEVGTTLHLNC